MEIMNRKHGCKQNRAKRLLPLYLFTLSLLVASCSQIDCPLNNRAYAVYRFMNSVGDSVVVDEVITVSTTRDELEDSVRLNQFTGKSTFSIPMSYTQREDVLFFEVTGDNYSYIDTVVVEKESHPHFESVDCHPIFFHTLKKVTTTHHAIDSITIHNKNVSYDSHTANLHIYLRSSN